MMTRAVTAAPGLQPAESRLEANEPEVPNVAPDSSRERQPGVADRPVRHGGSSTSKRNDQKGVSSLQAMWQRERSQRAFCP